jgi:hypothetical protein
MNFDNNPIPRTPWTQAIQCPTSTKNRTPHRTLEVKSPIEIFNDRVPATIPAERTAFRASWEPTYIPNQQKQEKLAPLSEMAIIFG